MVAAADENKVPISLRHRDKLGNGSKLSNTVTWSLRGFGETAGGLCLIIALAVGILIYRTRVRILWPSLAALVLLYVLIWCGQYVEIGLPDLFGFTPTAAQVAAAGGDVSAAQQAAETDGIRAGWVILLFGYAFVASVLPVWLLLQPRDYVNSHQLFVALGIIVLGVVIGLQANNWNARRATEVEVRALLQNLRLEFRSVGPVLLRPARS